MTNDPDALQEVHGLKPKWRDLHDVVPENEWRDPAHAVYSDPRLPAAAVQLLLAHCYAEMADDHDDNELCADAGAYLNAYLSDSVRGQRERSNSREVEVRAEALVDMTLQLLGLRRMTDEVQFPTKEQVPDILDRMQRGASLFGRLVHDSGDVDMISAFLDDGKPDERLLAERHRRSKRHGE